MKTYKWTEQQKKALRGSIRKWARIVNGTTKDCGPESCACCIVWRDVVGSAVKADCSGCPIQQFTGADECANTPYARTVFYQDTEQDEANRAELNFLRAVYLAGGRK